MAEYASLKVPELKKLLAEKKLPQTGNKADLIARLQGDDKKNATATAVADKLVASKEEKEDEITYTDDEESAPAAAATPAPGPAPKPKPAPKPAEDRQKSASAAAEPAAQEPTEEAEKSKAEGEAAPAAPAESFALGLSATAVDIEAKKRADRAKRFGIEEDDEAKRRAERARRFGIDENELASGLDSALSERPLKRTRGRGEDDGNLPAKRQSGDRYGPNGRNGRAPRPANRGGILDDPVEKAKAEKRAARFAAA